MNILIICQYYYPEQFLINDIAPELVKNKHNVTVITGVPNYPQGEIYEGYANKHNEIIDGVNIIRCPIVPRGTSKIHLLRNYFSYMRLANKEAKKHDGEYDVVFLYQLTPIFQAYPAIKYAKRNHVKLLCYCLDLAPASGNEILSKFAPLMYLYTKFSKWAYSNCNLIAVSSIDFIEYIHKMHSIPVSKLIYLPQHASEGLLNMNLCKENDGITDFMFAGNLGLGARLDIIIYAIERIIKSGLTCRMHFVGNGRAKQQLQELARNLGIGDNIVFHGQVTMDEMPNMYRKADALIVSLRSGQITIPSKVQTYMATGKPIFGAMDGSGQKLINESNCGKCVPAEDIEGLAQLLSDYICNPKKYFDCGNNGRTFFVENFTLQKYMNRLNNLLGELK